MEPKSGARRGWLVLGLVLLLVGGQAPVRPAEATALVILTGACTVALTVALREAGGQLGNGLEGGLEEIRDLCREIFLRTPEEVALRQIRDLVEFVAEGNLARPDRAQRLAQLLGQLTGEITNGGGK